MYAETDLDERLFWGAEPVFDNAYGALEAFLAAAGVEYPTEYSIEFTDRVDRKLGVAWERIDD